jgi:hypothetical protein
MEPKTDDRGPATSKPSWLRRVEEESWQAELIISGAAIIGALQLPGLLDKLEVYLLLHQNEDALSLWRLVFMYLRLLSVALIFTFIFHFVVRALWIGMVGLNSVFPEGFRSNSRFSEDFQAKMRANYGDIDGYILKLDDLASGIFGTGFAAASLFLNFGLVFSAMVILIGFIRQSSGHSTWVIVGLLVFAIGIFILALLASILHAKGIREKPWVKRIHFPLTRLLYRIQFPINSRFTVTALNILSYQVADRKGYWFYAVGAIMLVVILGAATDQFFNPNSNYFYAGTYYREAADSTLIRNGAYQDDGYEGIYYGPVMPSLHHDTSDLFNFWVPLPERELELFRSKCAKAVVPDSLRDASLPSEDQKLLKCLPSELKISLNGTPVREMTAQQEYLNNAAGAQYGVRVLLEGVKPRRGKNLLSVATPSEYRRATDSLRYSYVIFFGE